MNNNPETYLLSHNRFIDYLVLIFTTNSNIIKYGFEYGFNDIKFPFAYDQTNIYYMLEKKNTNLLKSIK